MFQSRYHDYRLIDGCFHKKFEVHGSRSFSKQKKQMFKETFIFDEHQRDYRLNDGCFHKNLAIHLSNSFKIIFKWHSGKAELWTHVLYA